MKHNAAREARNTKKTTMTGAMLLATLALSACGGGDRQPATVVNHAGEPRPPGGSAIKWEGQSQSVKAVDGEVAVLWPSNVSGNYGSLLGNFSQKNVAAQALKEVAPGAYSVLADRASLLSGMITDLAGNGQYAIGRWTNGSLVAGQSYNANQGRAWAVGTPLPTIDFSGGTELLCKSVASTRPVALSGNTPPGKLVNGSARLYVDGSKQLAYDLSLEYSIGSDDRQRMATSGPSLGFHSHRVKRYTLQTEVFGEHPHKPYFALAYTMEAPTSGTIHGVTVMACETQVPPAQTQPTGANATAPTNGSQSPQGDSGTAAIDSPADGSAGVVDNEKQPASSDELTLERQPEGPGGGAANEPSVGKDASPSDGSHRPEQSHPNSEGQTGGIADTPSVDEEGLFRSPEGVSPSADANAARIARRNAEWKDIEERDPVGILPKN
jgi:hypothetical protein